MPQKRRKSSDVARFQAFQQAQGQLGQLINLLIGNKLIERRQAASDQRIIDDRERARQEQVARDRAAAEQGNNRLAFAFADANRGIEDSFGAARSALGGDPTDFNEILDALRQKASISANQQVFQQTQSAPFDLIRQASEADTRGQGAALAPQFGASLSAAGIRPRDSTRISPLGAVGLPQQLPQGITDSAASLSSNKPTAFSGLASVLQGRDQGFVNPQFSQLTNAFNQTVSALPTKRQTPEEAAAVAGAQTRATGEVQKEIGLGPFVDTGQAIFGASPGGTQGVGIVTDFQNAVLKSPAFTDFTNTLTSAIEARQRVDEANLLEQQGITQGVGIVDKQLATLLARSLEKGRLTDDDIKRATGEDDRAFLDRIQIAFGRALKGEGILPGEREVIAQITRSRALERAAPILQKEIELRLVPFQNLPQPIQDRIKQSVNIDDLIQLVLQGGNSPSQPTGASAFDRALNQR